METIRYGVFPRFEIEALVPYVYGTDRVTEGQRPPNRSRRRPISEDLTWRR